MIRKEKNNLVWFEFSQLQQFPEICHAVFSRKGGVSSDAYSSLNTSYTVGDKEVCVQENIHRIFQTVCDSQDTLIFAEQIHSDSVASITDYTSTVLAKADGLVTNLKNTVLCVRHADCQSAIFYDPVQKVLANIHAGWRGNVANIYAKTIQTMKQKYHCAITDIRACISPSLGPYCAQFIDYKNIFPQHFWPYQLFDTYFDLWEIAKMQLMEAGILERHIEIARMCTYTDEENFFSYRRSNVCGRNLTLIGLHM